MGGTAMQGDNLPEFISPATANMLRKGPQTNVGDLISIWWSNGASFSLYHVNDGDRSHTFTRVADYDITNDGGYVRITVAP